MSSSQSVTRSFVHLAIARRHLKYRLGARLPTPPVEARRANEERERLVRLTALRRKNARVYIPTIEARYHQRWVAVALKRQEAYPAVSSILSEEDEEEEELVDDLEEDDIPILPSVAGTPVPVALGLSSLALNNYVGRPAFHATHTINASELDPRVPRFACRTCDYTIAHGTQGVHGISHHNAQHVAMNEEVMDTLPMAPLEEGADTWKLARVKCPCCGSSLGSIAALSFRSKALLKMVNLVVRPDQGPALPYDPQLSSSNRLASSKIAIQAGIRTHHRRTLLDVASLSSFAWPHELREGVHEYDDPKSFELRQQNGLLFASALKQISKATRASSLVEIYLASEETLASRRPELCAWLISRSLSMSENNKISLLMTTVLRDYLDHIATNTNPDWHQLIPVRVLARTALAFARSEQIPLWERRSVLRQTVEIIQKRLQTLSEAAGAYGASREYLERAAKELAVEESVLADALVDHPTRGARFNVPLGQSGFPQIFCSHPKCTNAASRRLESVGANPTTGTSKFTTLLDAPYAPKNTKLDFGPTHCAMHASPQVSDTMVMKPVDPKLYSFYQRRVAPATFGRRPDGSPGGHSFTKRINHIVPVPDPTGTQFPVPSPGVLPLTLKPARVHVFYGNSDADSYKQAIDAIAAHVKRAEDLMAADPYKAPSPETAIGIDGEWKPQFFYNKNAWELSILQISTRTDAYIFDLIGLNTRIVKPIMSLLSSPAVMKLGHGLGEDLYRTISMFARKQHKPALLQSSFPIPGIVELAPIYEIYTGESLGPRRRPSLAKMVSAAHNLTLDKRCQMTDWERRPLSPAQIAYAALDAHCAFGLFDHFSNSIVAKGQSKYVLPNGKFDVRPFLQADEGKSVPQEWPQRAGATAAAAGPAPTTLPTKVFVKPKASLKTPVVPGAAASRETLAKAGVSVAASTGGLITASAHMTEMLDRTVRSSFVDAKAAVEAETAGSEGAAAASPKSG